MSIRVLGCSGGLSGENQQGSTCIQISETTLIDAGTGLSSLSLEEMYKIRHIFLTHAHMDHIAALPTFLSNLFEQPNLPVNVYGLPETLERLKDNIFNGEIWPDFTHNNCLVKLIPIAAGQVIEHENMVIDTFTVDHTIPTLAYSIKKPSYHFVFCSDCTENPQLVADLKRLTPIDILMLECSFPDRLAEIAEKTKHMTPSMVHRTLAQLTNIKHIWLTHLKPSYEQELRRLLKGCAYTVL